MDENRSTSPSQDYLKLRTPFISVCVLVIALALLQYLWNSNSESTPQIIRRYSRSLAYSLIHNLPSRFLLSGSLSRLGSPLGHEAHWRKHYRPALNTIANQNNLDPRLVEILISVESSYRVDAISPRGAVGLMQVMPMTALDMGISNPFDPIENMHAGCRYLKHLLKIYKGDISLALAAYNAGPGNVDKYGGIPPFPETQSYVKKIMKQYRTKA